MRIRKKKWAPAELNSALFFMDNPKDKKGQWKNSFGNPQNPFWVELGCGKAVSTALLASRTENVNILAIDLKSDILAVAKRNVDKAFGEAGRYADNLFLTAYNIEKLDEILSPEDKIDRLLINFCNPWPKAKCHKHRLTHTNMLKSYKKFMKPQSLLVFKTDDDDLFLATRDEYLSAAGFDIMEEMWDLPTEHEESRFLSEHEKMFRERGLPIHYIVAKPTNLS